jgi:ATP-binding protein involved in chromosome partitioning
MRSYEDIAGDGGSRIVEQVTEQRARIERGLAGVRRVLAVGSGKGGVGKSTLTIQLARALHGASRRCAVLDADLNGPSQARLAGLRDAPLVPGERGLALPRTPEGLGVVSLGGVIPESEALDFDSVAHGDTHVWRATREFGLLSQLLASVDWGELELLLVDLPPGAERTLQFAEFLGPRVAFLLVTLPSGLSRGIVARSLAALARTGNPVLGYVENMKGYYCADCDRLRPLFPQAAGAGLSIPCLGGVPFDPRLAAMGDDGALAGTVPAGATARALRAVAERVRQSMEALG